jgi:hypothetical protein
MKRTILSIALILLAAASLAAIPSVYKTYADGWMCLGIGASLSLPDGKLSVLFDFEVAGPEQFGLGVSVMIGERWRCTLNLFYLLDPTPDSSYAIPIVLKAGMVNIDFDKGDLGLGLALATGIRLYPLALGPGDADSGGMHLTGDLQAAVYWNFRAVDFSIDVFPGILFSLVDGGYYYY